MNYTNSEKCLIWLDSFLGLEYKHKEYLYKSICESEKISKTIEDNKEYLIKSVGENLYSTILNSANSVYFNFVLESLERKGVKVITILSNGYPERLKETDAPPLVLYYMGDISLLNTEILGIVGSRKSIPLSIGIAKDYAKELLDADFTLITGIAEGVDEAVLSTAVSNNKKVISVITGGFDNLYPKTNQGIFDKVKVGGLVISEYPPEVKPEPYYFPVRNRIIAGLSMGVIIISAGKRSGTFYTAGYADNYNRDVFAVPYSVGISSGVGSNDLIKTGVAKLTDSAQDILEYYGKNTKKESITLPQEEQDIINILNNGEQHIEYICEKLNKGVAEINSLLTIMEIKGLVIKTGVNMYGLYR